jgi:hypothetical protein
MKKMGIVLLTILTWSIISSQVAESAVTPGSKCTKEGMIQLFAGKKYSCIKLGKKLFWDNGIVVIKPNNSLSPVPNTVGSSPQASTSLREISRIEGQVTDWILDNNGGISVTVLIRWTVPTDPNRAGFKIYYQNSQLGQTPACDLKIASCAPAPLMDPTIYEFVVNDPEAKTLSIPKVRAYSLEAFKVCVMPKDANISNNQSLKCTTGMVNTLVLTELPKPKLSQSDVVREGGNLKVSWQGLDFSGAPYRNTFKRINVYVKNNSDANPHWVAMGFINSAGESFKLPISISSYSVRITAVSTLGLESSWSEEFTIPAYVGTITNLGS